MSFSVSLERRVPVDRRAAFSRFADYARWSEWMPRSFRPLSGPRRALESGDWLLLSIDFGLKRGVPSPAKVLAVDSGQRITWRGGVVGLLIGEHTFHFEEVEPGVTLVRSDEHFSGLVVATKPGAAWVRRLAERIGSEQLDGFARSFDR
jgi:hypothetical protein